MYMRVKTIVCAYASAKNAWKLYIQVKPVYGIVPSRLLVRCSVIRSSACHSFLKEWEVTLPCSYRSTCLFFSSYDAFHHRGGHQVLLRPGLPCQQQRAHRQHGPGGRPHCHGPVRSVRVQVSW